MPYRKWQRTDLRWGRCEYPVTKTQKSTLDALLKAFPVGCSAYDPESGAVIIGSGDQLTTFAHRTVEVGRDGRVYENSSTQDLPNRTVEDNWPSNASVRAAR
jgi:hypothetical protein